MMFLLLENKFSQTVYSLKIIFFGVISINLEF